jgi:hypothetical protein
MTDHPPNRLAKESSPYLLQHSHNPVDWYAWGDEALGRSRAEDKPILLSIGYSACHWCHVMERESFEDAGTAQVMNDLFVNIKVDREERPDLDHIYQTAIQVLGRNGGWPLTMFLTPELKPFFGGTYFPPVDRYGMRSFRRIMESVSTAYRDQRAQVNRQAEEIAGYLGEVEHMPGGPSEALSAETVRTAATWLLKRFDTEHGGFGERPKFPNSTALELWLRHAHTNQAPVFAENVAFTVRNMIHAGIYDQLGGGFHRYSTDERWLIPHFEKMLYDNALLLRLLAQLIQSSGDETFRRGAGETAEYVHREMTHPEGAFYSTQDADSEGVEGKFFAWTEKELKTLIPAEDSELILRAFGVEPGGNFEHGLTVLHRPLSVATLAKLYSRTDSEVETALARARWRLYEVREHREHPLRDDKVLTGWNGLMIQGLASVGVALNEPKFVGWAQDASEFVAKHLWRNGTLLRTWRDGQAKIEAFGEDHAFLAEGELTLFEATGDPKHLQRARTLADIMLDRFVDPAGGFFVTPVGGEALIQRPKSIHDNAVPSATSSMTMVLLRLHALTGEGRYGDAADRILRTFEAAMEKNPFAYSYLVCALEAATTGVGTLVVTGAAGDPTRESLLSTARSTYAPNLVVVPWAAGTQTAPEIASLVAGKGDSAAAYLCRNGTCSAPVRSPEALRALLAEPLKS